MPAHIEPEDWWDVDAVQRLLTNILEQPNADHSMGVQDVLRDSGGVLLDAHTHTGSCVHSDKLVGKKNSSLASVGPSHFTHGSFTWLAPPHSC